MPEPEERGQLTLQLLLSVLAAFRDPEGAVRTPAWRKFPQACSACLSGVKHRGEAKLHQTPFWAPLPQHGCKTLYSKSQVKPVTRQGELVQVELEFRA